MFNINKKLLDHKRLECKSPITFKNFKFCKNKKNSKPFQMEKVEGNVELFLYPTKLLMNMETTQEFTIVR
jgi:hypothetical protein